MKKLYIVLIVFVFLTVFVGCTEGDFIEGNNNMFSNNQEAKLERDENTDNMEDSNEGHSTKENSNVFEGTVTEVVYEEVIPYLNNRIVVKQAGRYGIIDNQGESVMPITQNNPIEPLNMNAVMFFENNKFGVLSTYGDELLPAIYDNAYAINEDLIRLETSSTYIKNGVLYKDINGTQHDIYSISQENFVGERITGQNTHFYANEDVFAVSWSDTSNGDNKNYFAIFNIYGKRLHFEEGYGSGSFYIYNGKHYIVTDKKVFDVEGIVCDLSNTEKSFLNSDYGFFNTDKILIKEPVKYENYRWYYNYYVFNLNDLVIEPIESIAENIGISEIKDNGFYEIYQQPEGTYHTYYGLMNDKFQTIVEPIYNSIGDYINGYFPVELDDYIGYADEKGNIVHPTIAIEDLQTFDKFAYSWTKNNGMLINPSTGESLPCEKADLINDSDYFYEKIENKGIYEAILTDEDTGEKYKSFVTWDGPIVSHKFPNKKISVSNDGKVAVYNKGAVFTIVELP